VHLGWSLYLSYVRPTARRRLHITALHTITHAILLYFRPLRCTTPSDVNAFATITFSPHIKSDSFDFIVAYVAHMQPYGASLLTTASQHSYTHFFITSLGPIGRITPAGVVMHLRRILSVQATTQANPNL
jgi:hypothetical protein